MFVLQFFRNGYGAGFIGAWESPSDARAYGMKYYPLTPFCVVPIEVMHATPRRSS